MRPPKTPRSSARQSPCCADSKVKGGVPGAGVRRLIAPVLCLLFVAAGCSSSDTSAPPAPSLSDEIQQFLDGRAELLASGDIEGYLASVAAPAMELEGPIATGAATVPLTDISFTVSRTSRDEAQSLTDRRVDLSYTYEGLPADNTFRISIRYDFTRVGDSWGIETATLRRGSRLPVWATGAVLFERSDHFLAVFRPDVDSPQRVLSDAEQARDQLGEKVPFPLENTYLLLVAGDDDQYRQMAGTSLGPISPIAQVETSYEVTPDSIRVLGRQMVINRQKLYENGQSLETLRHELGHLLLAKVTRPFTPAWVSEAAAMYLAGTRTVPIWRDGVAGNKFADITIDRLTRASSLGEHGTNREGTSLEYAYSAAAAWYLVETYGPEQFWQFYSSYEEFPAGQLYDRLPERVPGLDGRPPADAPIEELAVETTVMALDRFYDLTPTQLDVRIRGWMSRQ